MNEKVVVGLWVLFLLLPSSRAAAELPCPADLADYFQPRDLHYCPWLYKKLCASVCGPRYDAFDIRGAGKLASAEQYVVCLDSSVEQSKNGVLYSEDRKKQGCFVKGETYAPGGAARAWCTKSDFTYKGRNLGAYLQCSGRLNAADAALAGPAPVQPRKKLRSPNLGLNAEDYGGSASAKLASASMTEAALAQKGRVLAAVKRYFVDHAGDFPRALSDLVPKYIKAIPEIQIPGYKKTNGVTVVTQMAGDDITGFLGDTGGFLYIAAPGARRGEVRIDSVKKYRGNPLYEY